MRKIICYLLILVVASLTLTACQSGSDASSSDSALSEEITESASSADSADTNISGRLLTRGTWSGNTYKSSYSGITFNKPDAWTVASDEVISQQTGISIDKFNEAGVEFTEDMLNELAIYDALVIDYTSGNNVFILYENLQASDNLDVTVDDYIDYTKQSISSIYDCTYGDTTQIELGGSTYSKFLIDMTSEAGAYQYQYIRKIDNYMLVITITLFDGDIETIEGMFS